MLSFSVNFFVVFQSYLIPPPGGDVPSAPVGKPVLAHDMTGLSYTGPFLPGPFAGGAPFFPSYAPTFVRPSYSYPNGDVLYTYQPQPAPYLPSPLVTYTSSIPPPKIACYNCSSQSHHPNECKEPTMEEYSSKGEEIFFFFFCKTWGQWRIYADFSIFATFTNR